MKAGFFKFQLPHNKDFSLVGYADRSKCNEGIMDPVYFKVAYLEFDKGPLVICAGDVVAINSKLTKGVRDRAGQMLNINPESIMLNASHTHSSYVYVRADQESPLRKIIMDPDLTKEELASFDKMVDLLVNAILKAKESAVGAKMTYARSSLEGLGANRNNPKSYYDNNLHLLKIKDSNNTLIGLIATATCHPTILNSKSYKVSADFPGSFRKVLEENHPGLEVIFLQGPAGDVSTRYTRQGQDYDEVKRMGRVLAEKVETLLEKEEVQLDLEMAASPKLVLGPRDYDENQEIDHKISLLRKELDQIKDSSSSEYRRAQVKLQGAEINKYFRDNIEFDQIETHLQVVDFGKVKLLGIPGEPMSDLAKDLYEKLGPDTIILGYTNDYIGYIVGEEDLGLDLYEEAMMVVEKSSQEKIKNTILDSLKYYKFE